ncbi:MAG: gliding motility-associated C-terminal domain-containing protein, partial [Salinivirgaceae bacterium]|nr:gliding motility-associated C-terminal domain-containing protein [Salinivirgaceae bacterium]
NRFVIYKKQPEGSGFIAFDTISNTLPFTYTVHQSNIGFQQWQYTIAAMSNTDSLSNLATFHGNMVLSFLDFNVCDPSINVQWNQYIGANNIEYTAVCILENEIFDQHEVGTNRTGNLDLMYGKEHKIAVRAAWDGGSSISAFRTYVADSIRIDPNISITRIEDTNSEYVINLKNRAAQHRDSIYIELYSPETETPYNQYAFSPEQKDIIEVSVPKTIPITEIKTHLSDSCQNKYNNGKKVGTINVTATDETTHIRLQWNTVNHVNNLTYSLYSDTEFIANLGTGNTYEHPLNSGSYDSDKICFQILASNDTIEILSNTVCLTLTDDLIWPNAFTPNGDGFDDQFGPVVSRFFPESYTLLIFNKNGLLLFNSSSVDKKWSGEFNGKLVQQGGYIWQSEYSIAGKRYKKQGIVNIIY